jgi:transcriptional regulator with PAS, ATPase and Fis domain
LGENGTGKELIAREIHRRSGRAQGVFIGVDLGALSENLLESELFGHRKGAFTGAEADRMGRFEAAKGGSLFLDEIGNLSLAAQAKLLTVLQQRQVVRLGSHEPIPLDIRLISATNQPLPELVQEGKFRQDLYFRLNTVTLTLPPLRERPEDLPLLIDHFVALFAPKYRKPGLKVSVATRQKLQAYAWPGNIRELRHAIERAVIMSEGASLQPADFVLVPAAPSAAEASAPESLNLAEHEEQLVREALRRHEGNISQAAKALGLTRAALYRRMEKFGL